MDCAVASRKRGAVHEGTCTWLGIAKRNDETRDDDDNDGDDDDDDDDDDVDVDVVVDEDVVDDDEDVNDVGIAQTWSDVQ